MTKRINWLSLFVLASGAFLAPPRAEAYHYTVCGKPLRWSNQQAAMYVSTTSIPPGSALDGRLQNAMARWNNVKGSTFNFFVGRDTDGVHDDNGVNEVYFTGLSDSIDGALAVTHLRWDNNDCSIKEADIVFNTNQSWTVSPFHYDNIFDPYNFEGVALHELGHALGLSIGLSTFGSDDHETRWLATMNTYYPMGGPFGNLKQWDPFADDRQGVRFLYPDSTAETEIAPSVFTQTDPPGSSIPIFSPISAHAGGQPVSQWFTFSNLSTSRQTFNIGFYLSTDDNITTADRLLATNSGAWGDPGFTGIFNRDIPIPSDVPPGEYYLGFIVDYDQRISESNESNNGQPMSHSIIIQAPNQVTNQSSR